MKTITGQLGKISTTADGSVRLQIDVKYEDAADIMQWLYKMVDVELIDDSPVFLNPDGN